MEPTLPVSKETHASKYRSHGETFKECCNRIANELKDDDEHYHKFRDILLDMRFLPAGRVQAAMGSSKKVTGINCFVSGTIADSFVEGEGNIMQRATEAAATMRMGGGIGYDFSTLRPAGDLIRSLESSASGPVSFMDIYNSICKTIASAGHRRGAQMGVLRVDHPDIEAFIYSKQNSDKLTGFNISIAVTDEFMVAVKNGTDFDLKWEGKTYRTIDARNLFEKIMRSTWDYAEPGVLFIDRINEKNNLYYCETIAATNPCVTFDTWVHTSEGPRQVIELVGRPFTAMVDGLPYPTTRKGFFSSGKKPIFELKTQEGYKLTLTEDHPILQSKGRGKKWVKAGLLEPGDKIMINNHKGFIEWSGPFSESEGYLIGLLIGDGTLKDNEALLCAWPGKEIAPGEFERPGVEGVMMEAYNAALNLPRRFDFKGWYEIPGRGEYRMKLAAVRNLAHRLGIVRGNKIITNDVHRTSSGFQIGLLRGLFDADGTVGGSKEKGLTVRLGQSNEDILENVQKMLLRFGIASTIYRNRRKAGPYPLPDGHGGLAEYHTKASHELVISKINVAMYKSLIGFGDTDKRNKLELEASKYTRGLNRENFQVTVESMRPLGFEEEVFDVTVPDIRSFDANGLVVSNCGEQPLPPFGACLLGSFNLVAYLEEADRHKKFEGLVRYKFNWTQLRRDISVVVRAMDNVTDRTTFPLKAQRREAESKRRMGLGVTGTANAGEAMGHVYGSPAFITFVGKVLRAINEGCYRASAELAKEKGPFPLFNKEKFLRSSFVKTSLSRRTKEAISKNGIRNSHLTSIAPTGTISLCADNISSGIEPVFSLSIKRTIIGPSGPIIESIDDYGARVFGIRGKVSSKCTADDHLSVLIEAYKWVDSAVSKTCNVSPTMPWEDFKQIYMRAWENGCKGVSTFNPGGERVGILQEDEEGVKACFIDPVTGLNTCE